jgi:hypothetical protein
MYSSEFSKRSQSQIDRVRDQEVHEREQQRKILIQLVLRRDGRVGAATTLDTQTRSLRTLEKNQSEFKITRKKYSTINN